MPDPLVGDVGVRRGGIAIRVIRAAVSRRMLGINADGAFRARLAGSFRAVSPSAVATS